MILVSIDDHVVEPPDMFRTTSRPSTSDQAPMVVTDEQGVDQWMYQGRPQGVSGLNAVVSWPTEEWGFDPAGFAEMRPGVYDVHERVRDMDRNGILASMCFPTFTGFSARHLNQHRKDVTLVMVSGLQRLAHRRVGGRVPGPLHPARAAADVGPRGDVRRDPPGRGQGLPRHHHARSCRTSKGCRATTTSSTGTRSSRRCPRRTW